MSYLNNRKSERAYTKLSRNDMEQEHDQQYDVFVPIKSAKVQEEEAKKPLFFTHPEQYELE